jgi:hypothetical protein
MHSSDRPRIFQHPTQAKKLFENSSVRRRHKQKVARGETSGRCVNKCSRPEGAHRISLRHLAARKQFLCSSVPDVARLATFFLRLRRIKRIFQTASKNAFALFTASSIAFDEIMAGQRFK